MGNIQIVDLDKLAVTPQPMQLSKDYLEQVLTEDGNYVLRTAIRKFGPWVVGIFGSLVGLWIAEETLKIPTQNFENVQVPALYGVYQVKTDNTETLVFQGDYNTALGVQSIKRTTIKTGFGRPTSNIQDYYVKQISPAQTLTRRVWMNPPRPLHVTYEILVALEMLILSIVGLKDELGQILDPETKGPAKGYLDFGKALKNADVQGVAKYFVLGPWGGLI